MNLSSRGFGRSLTRILLSGLCLGTAAALAACGGAVGSGNAPRNLVISAPSSASPLPSLKMYQCLTSGLRALLYFDDGSVGDFTNRVVWTSSNPGAVKVSNGDLPAPGGFYAHGALVPDGTGTAIITADYFGVIAQTAVSVGPLVNPQLKAVIDGNYVPLWRINTNHTSPSNAFTMGQGTQVQVAVTAVLDNAEADITNFATIGFQTPNNGVATVSRSSTGVATLTAGNFGGPVVPMASFSSCDLTTITDANNIVNMSVAPVQSIAMQPEFPPPDPTQPVSASNPLPQLIVGNSERFRVIASLADGNSQDVSTQSSLSVAQGGSFAQFGGTSGVNNLLFASAPGGIVLQASFNQGGATLTAPSIVTSTATRVLQTFQVCWTDIFTTVQNCPSSQPQASVQAGVLTPLQFHAIGYYGTDSTTGQAILQEVTRSTSWSTDLPAVATIGNGGNSAGQARGVSEGTTTVQASNASAVNIPQVYTQLQVTAPP
ncbi:MAG TPA: hypothetical protein VFA75_01995 [Nevskia sp.]|nr:hypothetical protein [Nevskia sp.]